MKRYWKLISLTAIIVLTIGTFYIQSSLAKSQYPNFFIETVRGDEAILNDLTVIGHYDEQEKEGVRSEISVSGTSYTPNYLSYTDILLGAFTGERIKQLQKKYRNFMRGKDMESNFVEDDEVLVYADLKTDLSSEYRVKSATFEVDVLQKDSKNIGSFSVPISLEGTIDFLYILNVEMFDDTLQIITDRMIQKDDRFENQLTVTRLDLASGKLLGEQKIDFSNTEASTSIYPIVDGRKDSQSDYIIFSSNIYEEVEVMYEEFDHEKVGEELIVYHVETDQQEVLELPAEVDLGFDVDSLIGDTIYLTKELEDELQVVGYNIKSKQIETDYTIDLNQGPKDERVTAYIQGDYLSIVSPLKSTLVDAAIKVGDVKTGEILYEGSIEIDPDAQVGDYELEISHIVLD